MSATSERLELVERYEVLNIINDAIAHNALSYENCVNEIMESVMQIPAADVRPVVRGDWKYRGQQVIDDLFPTYACSVCHDVIPADWRRKCNFCPNCGADMREES